MKKLISIAMTLVFALSACTSKTEKTIVANGTPDGSTAQEDNSHNLNIQDIKEIASSEFPNIAVAEILGHILQGQSSKQQLPMDPQGLQALQKSLQKNYEDVLYEKNPGRYSADFLKNSVLSSVSEMNKNGAFSEQITLQYVAFAQGDALRRILDIYNKQLDAETNDITEDIVTDMNQNQPDTINQIDSLISYDTQLRMKLIQGYLIKYDRVLAKYNFHQDGTKLIFYGLVATKLAQSLIDHKTIKAFVKVAHQIDDLNDKVKKISLCIESLNQYRESLHKSWSDVSSSFKSMTDNLQHYDDIITHPPSEETRGEVLRAMKDLFSGHWEDAPADEKGLFTQANPLDKDFAKFSASLGDAANSFNNIVSGLDNLAQEIGIDIPPEVQNIIATTQKISQGVELASSVIQAYSSGGLVSAVGMLSGGPAGALLGAGAMAMQQDQSSAYFAQIEKDLQEIKKMQQETIDLLHTNMDMIRELATMVDQYHREEMFRLGQIYRQTLSITQLIGLVSQNDFEACQSILNFNLVASSGNNSSTKLTSVDDVEMVKNLMLSKASSLANIQNLLTGFSKNDYSSCQTAFGKVFSDPDRSDSLLLRRFTGSAENQTSGAIDEATFFVPALGYLRAKTQGTSLQGMALNMPVGNVDALRKYKSYYIHLKSTADDSFSNENFRGLLSSELLEAYVSNLLVLHPFISIDEEDWKQKDSVMENLRSHGSTLPLASHRSAQWLKGAFRMTERAIAQESILAGEALLTDLALDWGKIAAETSNCTSDKSEEVNLGMPKDFCFVRQNPAISKNLLTYLLHDQALQLDESTYTANLAATLGVNPNRVFTQNGKYVLAWNTTPQTVVELPKWQEARQGLIHYSENMQQLVKMQKLLADEISKLTKNLLNANQVDTLSKVLILQK